MVKLRYLVVPSAILAVCCATLPAIAQGPGGATFSSPGNLSWGVSELGGLSHDQRQHAVAGKVMDLAGNVIGEATVQVSPLAAGEFRFLKADASGDFQTFYFLTQGSITDFRAWLTVKKSGFQTAHELIDYAEFPNPVRLPVTLRPDEPDANLLSQQELISHILPNLKSLGPSDGISAKDEKQYARGVQEYVEKGRPDRSLDDFLDVVGRNPDCAKCKTMLALAELDSGDWDGAARKANAAAQMTVKTTTGGSPEALLLGGVMESWMHNPQEATNYLAWADKLDPKDPLVLQEIGRAQLDLQKYDVADAYLEKAIDAGAGPDARLLRVQALLGEEDLDSADAQMKLYLNGRKPKTLPADARRVWDMVQNRNEIRTLYVGPGGGKRRNRKTGRVDYLDYTAEDLKGLEPAKDQTELEPILEAVGKKVTALFRDFQSTTSVEEIRQEKIGRNGKVSDSIEGKFRYLCLMPSDPAVPGFTEYRQAVDQKQEGMPSSLDRGYMLTSGFVSATLMFHPTYQPGSKFRYLGKLMMDGRETYVVAFAQIPMKAELIGNFRSGEQSAPTFEQGLAWIDAQNDQIVRLRTDLLEPLTELRLSEESTQIDYQDVHFKKVAEGFWLPKKVTVTADWRGKMLRNEHQYSDYRLFNVQNNENIHTPNPPPADSKDSSNSPNQRR